MDDFIPKPLLFIPNKGALKFGRRKRVFCINCMAAEMDMLILLAVSASEQYGVQYARIKK